MPLVYAKGSRHGHVWGSTSEIGWGRCVCTESRLRLLMFLNQIETKYRQTAEVDPYAPCALCILKMTVKAVCKANAVRTPARPNLTHEAGVSRKRGALCSYFI